MRACSSCGREVEDTAPHCSHCGTTLRGASRSALAEAATGDLRLQHLLLDVPGYVRQLGRLVRAPGETLGALSASGPAQLKAAVAFMLQGIVLAYILFTASSVVPQSIVGSYPIGLAMREDAQDVLLGAGRRIEEIKTILPEGLQDEWTRRGELLIATQSLPEARYQRMRAGISNLASHHPELLRRTIEGTLVVGAPAAGRPYTLMFFMVLANPLAAERLVQARSLLEAAPRHSLRPHVRFILGTVMLWFVTAWLLARFVPARTRPRASPALFVTGAYVVGTIAPLYEFLNVLGSVYLGLSLPHFVLTASTALDGASLTYLGTFAGGIFPYENTLLASSRLGVRLAVSLVALCAAYVVLRREAELNRIRAGVTAAAGLLAGFVATGLVNRLITALLAPTGLI